VTTCIKCGASLSEGARTCPSCGTEIVVEAKPGLVESLSFEHIFINEQGISLRVKNTGTAPLVISRVIFNREPTPISSVSAPSKQEGVGKLSLEPGEVGDLTFQPSYFDVSDIGFPTVLISESGRKYDTIVTFS